MGAKKSKKEDFSDIEIEMEKAVRLGPGGLTREKMKEAKAKALAVDEARANKVLKSVRYDEDLLAQIQKLADDEGIPYQTLMNSLLKAGLKLRLASQDANLLERIERIEKKLFAKHG